MTSDLVAPTQEHVERESEAAPFRLLSSPFEDAVTIAAEGGPAEAEPVHVATEDRHRARHFVRHLVEMVLAMMIGMAALGAVWGAILTAYGEDVSAFKLHHAALFALVMALDMTVPMVWWMRLRGHDWARGGEMAGAMFVPTFFLIGFLQLGAVSGESLIGLQHALMLPAMLLVMFWRIDEYTRPHARVAVQPR